jgi:hypothetical protein
MDLADAQPLLEAAPVDWRAFADRNAWLAAKLTARWPPLRESRVAACRHRAADTLLLLVRHRPKQQRRRCAWNGNNGAVSFVRSRRCSYGWQGQPC